MEDSEIQEKINYEVKMREGTVKLLEACHEQSQALEGAKNLLTINARIIALMSLLQRNRKQTMSSKTKPDFSKGRRYCNCCFYVQCDQCFQKEIQLTCTNKALQLYMGITINTE